MVHSIKTILGFSTGLQWLGLSTDLKCLVYCIVMVYSMNKILGLGLGLGFGSDLQLLGLSTDLKWLVFLYCHGIQYE